MKKKQIDMFGHNPADLPLFSGTAQEGRVDTFNPQPVTPQPVQLALNVPPVTNTPAAPAPRPARANKQKG